MTSFDARLRVVGEGGFPLGVEVDLTGERMIVSTGGNQLADWSLEEIRISPTPSGFRIDAEGEAVILNVSDGDRFAAEIGPRIQTY
jgi:regulation of enolase protein 1 (concanavalin A-like superfamily)